MSVCAFVHVCACFQKGPAQEWSHDRRETSSQRTNVVLS